MTKVVAVVKVPRKDAGVAEMAMRFPRKEEDSGSTPDISPKIEE